MVSLGCITNLNHHSLECLLLFHHQLLDRVWRGQMGLFSKRKRHGYIRVLPKFFLFSRETNHSVHNTSTVSTGPHWPWQPLVRLPSLSRTQNTSLSLLTSSWEFSSLPPSSVTSAPWSPTWTRPEPTSGTRWMLSSSTWASEKLEKILNRGWLSGLIIFGPINSQWMNNLCWKCYLTNLKYFFWHNF